MARILSRFPSFNIASCIVGAFGGGALLSNTFVSGALVGASCEDDEAGFGVFADGKPADDDRGDDLLDMTVWLVESIVWVVFEVMVSADTEREGKLCVIVLCYLSRKDINSLANLDRGYGRYTQRPS